MSIPKFPAKVSEYTPRFRQAWLGDECFKQWLKPVVGDDTKAMCKFCRSTMNAHLSSLISHTEGKKHIDNAKAMGTSKPGTIASAFQPKLPDPIKISELKLAAFIAEHCSTLAVDHLGELTASLDAAPSAKGVQLHRSKCIRLQKHVMAPAMAKSLRSDIGDSFYSLIIDESTNVSNIQCLGIIVRFYSSTRAEIVDTMYRLISIESATADALYTKIVACLAENSLDLNKMIGIGCDGANTTIGKNHSVASLLKINVPNLVVFRCVCHSLHLAASKAVDGLPVALEFLVRETHSWFSCSPKRMLAYRALYDVMSEKNPVKIPGHCETRWLARMRAVSAILDQWEVLHLHFQTCLQTERCYTLKQLSEMFAHKQNKLYLLCLRNILREVTRVNMLFQSEQVDVLKLTEDLLNLFRLLMQYVVLPAALETCRMSNLPSFPFREHLMPARCVHLGYDFEQAASTVPQDVVAGVRERCREFIIELVTQLQARLPENVQVMLMLSNLNPTVATA
jgi:hypothetical protein